MWLFKQDNIAYQVECPTILTTGSDLLLRVQHIETKIYVLIFKFKMQATILKNMILLSFLLFLTLHIIVSRNHRKLTSLSCTDDKISIFCILGLLQFWEATQNSEVNFSFIFLNIYFYSCFVCYWIFFFKLYHLCWVHL